MDTFFTCTAGTTWIDRSMIDRSVERYLQSGDVAAPRASVQVFVVGGEAQGGEIAALPVHERVRCETGCVEWQRQGVWSGTCSACVCARGNLLGLKRLERALEGIKLPQRYILGSVAMSLSWCASVNGVEGSICPAPSRCGYSSDMVMCVK